MNNKKKSLLVLVSLVLVLCFGAGGTLAYLIHQSGPITNEFQPTEVTTTVEENVDNGVKTDVKIKNNGSTEAYIRAAVVITWQDTEGNIYGQLPVAGTDYQITWSMDNWVEKDGFYYYKQPVVNGGLTDILFTNCKPLKPCKDTSYNLCVEIIASGIQSQPRNVAESVWHVTIDDDGKIS